MTLLGHFGRTSTIGKAFLVGGILGADAVGTCVALATLVFAGPLAAFVGTGAAVMLFATLISTVTLIWFGGIRGALGTAQDTTIAIIAPAVAAAAAAASTAGDPEASLATGLMIIGSSTAIVGLTMWLMGRFKLGNLARLLPYPVAAGFLAGSGWLLSFAALSLISDGADSYLAIARSLIDTDLLVLTLPTLCLAALLLGGQHFFGGSRALLAGLLIALTLFYGTLWFMNVPISEVRSMGLLPNSTAGSPWANISLDFLLQADWRQFPDALPSISVVVVICIVGFFLNTTGAELALRANIDINRELRINGLSNVLIGTFGGLASYIAADSTIIAHRTGLQRSVVAVGYLFILVVGFLFGGSIIGSVPLFVSAGLLLFIGLSTLDDWLLRTRPRLAQQDWAIVVVIVLITASWGIFPAILSGLIIALIIFVISYSRVPILRRDLTQPARRSNVDRSPVEEAFLRTHTSRISWAPLQGFLFFGSVDRLIAEVDKITNRNGEKNWLLLDFSLVSGMDSSACASIEKLSYTASERNLMLAMCGLSDDIMRTMERWQPGFLSQRGIQYGLSLDQSLETIEDELLADGMVPQTKGQGLVQILDMFVAAHPRRSDFIAALQQITLSDGDVLIRQGSQSRDIYLIEEGRLAILLNRADGSTVRLRSMMAGSIIGEVTSYLDLPRQADVVSQGNSVVWCLPEGKLSKLKHDHELTALIHSVMARALAEKLIANNDRLVEG